jgi:hypothetical protein
LYLGDFIGPKNNTYAEVGDNITLFQGINQAEILLISLAKWFKNDPPTKDTLFTITNKEDGIKTYPTSLTIDCVKKLKFPKDRNGLLDVIIENVSLNDAGPRYIWLNRIKGTAFPDEYTFAIRVLGKST